MPSPSPVIASLLEEARAHLPDNLQDTPWKCPGLNHGTNVLHDVLSLDSYLAAYGEMHWSKLQYAFQEFFKKIPASALNRGYELIDWGCGQGLGTLAFLDFLARRQPRFPLPTRLTLVEPSEVALERANDFLKKTYAQLPPVRLCNRRLPEATEDAIDASMVATACPAVVHIFSNVLDIASIDLKKLAELLASLQATHYVICVGPCNVGANRLDIFSRYFSLQPVDVLITYCNTAFARLTTGHSYSCLIKAFKLNAVSTTPPLLPYAFYPPAQYCCGYRLDMLESGDFPQTTGLETPCAFEVLAPFDLAACVCQDPSPLLATLRNMICRGLPTKASPFLEETCQKAFGLTRVRETCGTLSFPLAKQPSAAQLEVLSRTPLAVARVQFVVLQAMLTGKLALRPVWKVLALERDVPCCALAFQELAHMFNTLASLVENRTDIRFPDIQLLVISPRHPTSPLHLNAQTLPSLNDESRQATYDLILDVAVGEFCTPEQVSFDGLKTHGQCWFNVRSSRVQYVQRTVMTTERLRYRELVRREGDDNAVPIQKQISGLRYFLQLLFRKKDFREGQAEILHRALRLENVIGLLPTGGGKSLTYQLAAMLQPGVTLVVDPLKSLMQDQLDGLYRVGIDFCSYVNSSLAADENRKRSKQLALSSYLIFFISPERLCIRSFRQHLKDMNDAGVYFAYGVVDEVHCVSEWGHDFRFSYLHLGRNLHTYVLPKAHGPSESHISLIGLTATASFDVLADVERELSGNRAFPLPPGAIIRHENTNRLELQYRVVKVNTTTCRSKWDVYRQKAVLASRLFQNGLAAFLRQLQQPHNLARIRQRYLERENITDKRLRQTVAQTDLCVNVADDWYKDVAHNAAAIVFCPHAKGQLGVNDKKDDKNQQKETPGIASGIRQSLHCDVSTFSGDASDNISSVGNAYETAIQQQQNFINNQTGIMVATKAFGMGIDKPNIRFTMNMNHSGSLEAFVQEAGRAGRDGKMALATILYSDWVNSHASDDATAHGVDFEVHKYFYDLNFLGRRHENVVIYYLMTYQTVNPEIARSPGDSALGQPVTGFMKLFDDLRVDEECVFFLSYSADSTDFSRLKTYLREQCSGQKTDSTPDSATPITETQYKSAISRAVYRMCCIGLIDDFTDDYGKKLFRIVMIKKADGAYYQELEKLLTKYYSVERAAAEAKRARTFKGGNEIQKCLGFLSDFVYGKIAMKRLRAIQDMEDFCRMAANGTDWLEANENLKDYLYYYFNSKYARESYTAPDGQDYSLTTDTAHGKVCSFAIVRKYLRIIDDDMSEEGSPKDNIRHLQGAVRLIRRSLTDANPALDLLNVFCLVYLNVTSDTAQRDDLERSYLDGYTEFLRRSDDPAYFYENMAWFLRQLGPNGHNIADTQTLQLFDAWSLAAEAWIHADKARDIIQRFLKK